MHLIDPLVQMRRQPRTSRRPDTSNNLPLYCGVGTPRPPTPLIRSDLRLSNDSSIIRLSSQIYTSPSLVDLIYLPTIGDSVSRSLNPSACLNLTEPRHPTSRNPHPMYASSALLFTPHQPRRQPFSAILPLDRVIIPQITKLFTPHSGLAHLMPKYNYPYNGPRVLHDVSPSINLRPNRESGRLCARSGTRKPQKKSSFTVVHFRGRKCIILPLALPYQLPTRKITGRFIAAGGPPSSYRPTCSCPCRQTIARNNIILPRSISFPNSTHLSGQLCAKRLRPTE